MKSRKTPPENSPSSARPRGGAGPASPARILLALAVLFAAASAWRDAERTGGLDFYQFWVVGQALASRSDVYTDAARQEIGAEFLRRAQSQGSERLLKIAGLRTTLETYSTPFLYASFRLLSAGDYDRDLALYRALLLGGMAGGVAVLCRLLGFGFAGTSGALVVFLAFFEPFLSDLRVGNVNSLQLALLATFLLSQAGLRGRARGVAGGALLGLGVMFKPNLAAAAAAVLLSRALRRRWRLVVESTIGFALGAAFALVFAALSFGTPRCWAAWAGALQTLPESIITVPQGNFAAARFLSDRFGFQAGAFLALLFGVPLVLVLWRRRDHEDDRLEDAAAVAIGALFLLLTPRLVWLHYYLLAIPTLLLLLRPLPAAHRLRSLDTATRRVVPALAVIGLAMNPVRDVGAASRAETLGPIVCGSAVLLYVAGLVSLMSRDGA